MPTKPHPSSAISPFVSETFPRCTSLITPDCDRNPYLHEMNPPAQTVAVCEERSTPSCTASHLIVHKFASRTSLDTNGSKRRRNAAGLEKSIRVTSSDANLLFFTPSTRESDDHKCVQRTRKEIKCRSCSLLLYESRENGQIKAGTP